MKNEESPYMRWKRSSSLIRSCQSSRSRLKSSSCVCHCWRSQSVVELAVAEQLDVGGAVGRLLQRRVGGRLEVGPLGSRLRPGCLSGLHRHLSSVGCDLPTEGTSGFGQPASFAFPPRQSPSFTGYASARGILEKLAFNSALLPFH